MNMIIFWIVAGAFIGWNVPQPRYAKAIQGWVVKKIKGSSTDRRIYR
jgi:hypothetical protein